MKKLCWVRGNWNGSDDSLRTGDIFELTQFSSSYLFIKKKFHIKALNQSAAKSKTFLFTVRLLRNKLSGFFNVDSWKAQRLKVLCEGPLTILIISRIIVLNCACFVKPRPSYWRVIMKELCKCNIEGFSCSMLSRRLKISGRKWKNKYSQIWTSRLSNTFLDWMSEMGNEQRQLLCQMTDTFFSVFTKWHDCSSGTQRTAHVAISMKWNPTDGTALLLFQSSLQKVVLLSYTSLPLFIFTIACTFCASHPFFV